MESRIVGAPSPDVEVVDLDGELSLFDTRSGQAFALNRTASDVWALADGESTLDEVVSVLARGYGVEPEVIRSEVEGLVTSLEAAAVLVPAPPRT